MIKCASRGTSWSKRAVILSITDLKSRAEALSHLLKSLFTFVEEVTSLLALSVSVVSPFEDTAADGVPVLK